MPPDPAPLTLGSLPPPYDFMIHSTHPTPTEHDWSSFITAYALGRWDPHRSPSPPRSLHSLRNRPWRQPPFSEPPTAHYYSETISEQSASRPITLNVFPDLVDGAPSSSSSNLPSSSNFPFPRSRNSFSNSPLSIPATDMAASSYSNTEVQTTVATMRWAAARVDISPLALPSPEHELTDPMRGITAAIPGSHPEINIQSDCPTTPSSSRKSRLGSFWEGTTDVDGEEVTCASQPRLVPILHTPSDEQVINGLKFAFNRVPPTASSDLLSLPAAYTDRELGLIAGDYSEKMSVSPQEEFFSSDPAVHDSEYQISQQPPPLSPPLLSSRPSSEVVTPDAPRRMFLARQSSSPLPASLPHEIRLSGGRVALEGISPGKSARGVREEQMYAELGYLPPPYPPDELERRRALYKFNIWHTGPDVNFDRIAHLAKLVFNTKGSYISLIDGYEQFFKSGWRTMANILARTRSFCGHTILQCGDEPMVVLDARSDWRFSRNPLVVGAPHIRFYAGAPLRTHDGYNIGTLAIVDDSPREDFSPRQRHTLKEFAAIVMREMELWRDKIQLRVRDRIQSSMEQFSRECLEIDVERRGLNGEARQNVITGSSMDKVYDNAAKLVKRTLDVEGVILMEISHSEVLESISAEGTISVTMHHGDPGKEMTMRQLSIEEYQQLDQFFIRHPEGKISEGIVPQSFRPFLPTHNIQYALTVPIFNIDKRPFALICAYNLFEESKRFLEGHELSYLRAIGVIILSAVLKRRMILADKAKSLFISNISHELRTPLHGILAAAELLSDSVLNHSQSSFLQTIQACGTSLVETVNHVLDFTKLSGNSKSGGVENVIAPSNVDLLQLVEDAVDGCWVGHRARTVITGDSGIGSLYSPPKDNVRSPNCKTKLVETIVDIGYRPEGWLLKCEKGGIRRILMNLFGNSLKFTSDGFVHVQLRELPLTKEDPRDKVRVELSVVDTGKGISQNFLKNQLFHPFSQENPLQTGTGLGLAIVSSIVSSESVKGKIDVRSEEGTGTDIRVTFLAERPEYNETLVQDMMMFRKDDEAFSRPTITLLGFDPPDHKGAQMLRDQFFTYLTAWWNFKIVGPEYGNIVILNEDSIPVKNATERHDTRHCFIILSAARGSPTLMAIVSDYERIGGFCRVLYKPGGPHRLWNTLKLAVHAIKIGTRSRRSSADSKTENGIPMSVSVLLDKNKSNTNLFRRKSEDYKHRPRTLPRRPSMTPRATSGHPSSPWNWASSFIEKSKSHEDGLTVSVGTGGTLLKSSIGTSEKPRRQYRILVVEDNTILRNLLIKWLSKKGYNYREAVDGRDGVTIFKEYGPFDVVLLDLSMPVLDGIAATVEIRSFESTRTFSASEAQRTRILALTGMSSLEDKRKAFDAGVDGYLVKPVAFKTLDEMFHQLGIK